ncbi:MAG TPA: aminodeoxychorismate/anthranilate synthase component II [Xanthomonadales bacterium]|nr:aminodeoxychorismate/anthranilate synthase component II [Xanthomonadales bacterium]
MILMIDNYDSFTYNLVQYLGELGAEVKTVRNDAVTVDEVRQMKPEGIVISPGPCTPNEAGISVQLVEELGKFVPILGVCLGHQCIGQAFGAKIVRAERIMHGKTSLIFHRSQGVFAGLPQPFEATRYHSLVVENSDIPEELSVMAWTEYQGDHEIMGLKHRTFPVQGVQFHPESILTRCGHDLLKNFLQSISKIY